MATGPQITSTHREGLAKGPSTITYGAKKRTYPENRAVGDVPQRGREDSKRTGCIPKNDTPRKSEPGTRPRAHFRLDEPPPSYLDRPFSESYLPVEEAVKQLERTTLKG